MKLPVSENASYLKYQIREIVEVANNIKKIDPSFEITWENIGDPIPKGWHVPPFLKTLIKEEIEKEGDRVFGYSHSRGLPEVRQWVTEYVKRYCPSSNLTADDVLFTSGLGSAIATLYQMLPDGARVLQPSPSYPTHVSFESFRHRQEPILYNLDPNNNWEPDFDHIEAQVEKHRDVAGILLINPNNPTGAVYSREALERIVDIAIKHNLFIIADEIYFRMVYGGMHHEQMVEVVNGRVPLIVMRGMSKDVPWPGSRCGWIEFHNAALDEGFKTYSEAVKKRVMLEVCSTTLPQTVLSKVYDHSEFSAWIATQNDLLEENGRRIAEILSESPYLKITPTRGAFYMMPSFNEGVLNDRQTLPIAHEQVRAYIEELVSKPNIKEDQRFALYLLGATGICIVPASGFYSPVPGFRLTTLERNVEKRDETYRKLVNAIEAYVLSTEITNSK